ncbi:uncharacterized protein LOC103263051 [Carlito syrichta]|uniref:Copper transport protein ATOX1 n=1 Tax=Carlito syrichta TaxID=1868482 RepID=A0A1U7TM61_CARSF|nr:uncharacterized protein LOC103263051 [Carlito syrichta]
MPKHECSVDMTCEGCAKAASRVLDKLGGVKFGIDLPDKKVCIASEHSMDTLLETLKKTGKTVSYLASSSKCLGTPGQQDEPRQAGGRSSPGFQTDLGLGSPACGDGVPARPSFALLPSLSAVKSSCSWKKKKILQIED